MERLLDDYERLPEAEARLVLRRATSVEAERDEAERRVRDLEAVVSEHELDDPDLEAAHDLYGRLAAFAVGRLDEASSPAEVRAALSSLISEVRLGFEDGELVVAASLRVVEQEPQTLAATVRSGHHRDSAALDHIGGGRVTTRLGSWR